MLEFKGLKKFWELYSQCKERIEKVEGEYRRIELAVFEESGWDLNSSYIRPSRLNLNEENYLRSFLI